MQIMTVDEYMQLYACCKMTPVELSAWRLDNTDLEPVPSLEGYVCEGMLTFTICVNDSTLIIHDKTHLKHMLKNI